MTEKSSQLTECGTLAEFFKQEVERAIDEQRLETSQEVNFYLVQLLDAFTHADQVRPSLDEPLALMLHRAVFSRPRSRVAAYRRLGDVSLYTAGLFAPSLRRRSVDVAYAIRLGSGAYASVAALTRARRTALGGAVIPLLYSEMAEKFPSLVEVLTQIADRHSLGSDSPDLAELWERWSRCKAPHLWKRMTERRALPGTLTFKA